MPTCLSEFDKVHMHALNGTSNVEYTIQKFLYKHSPSGYVLGITPVGAQQPILIIAQSAALLRLKQPLTQLGLYAARHLRRYEQCGSYTGEILGRYKTASDASRSKEATAAERSGSDKLLCAAAAGGQGYDLIDGRKSCAPYLPLINDCSGTGLTSNLTSNGTRFYVSAKAGIRPFDFERPIEENAKAELLWSYGSGYWK